MRIKPGRFYCLGGYVILLAMLAANLVPAHPGEIFAKYRDQATAKLSAMSLEEKISQVLLVRYPDNGVSELAQYQFGGYVFFAKDFAHKTPVQVQQLMAELQSVTKIPILTAADEEGGLVVRVSNNSQLAESPFRSPQALYAAGGFAEITQDTKQKAPFYSLLALILISPPVVDVSADPSDYMYSRSLGEDAALTSEYARTVIEASMGGGVSYTLKHFPGYGNNRDTHKDTSYDERSYEEILSNDLLPFHAGIDAGAEAVLVSHNIVSSVDPGLPASLSPAVHQILQGALGFTGVIITDDIAMAALDDIANTTAQALLAGNDLVITTDYLQSMREIRDALASGELTEADLDTKVTKILAWKYYKGLIIE